MTTRLDSEANWLAASEAERWRHRTLRTPMTTPPSLPDTTKPKLTWYQHVWLALPFALVAVASWTCVALLGFPRMLVGGAIGGACGGAAWAINRQVFQKTEHPILRYVWTG